MNAGWNPDAVADYLREAGRLHVAWYVDAMALGDDAGAQEALEHFLAVGAPRGRGPNPELDRRGGLPAPAADDRDAVPARSHDAFARLVERTGAFDAATYLAANPDVQAAGLDPLSHFLRHGWRELRNPSAQFDVWWYWSTYLDPTSEAVNPLEHYLVVGAACGHRCRPPVVAEWSPGSRLAPGARRVCLFAA